MTQTKRPAVIMRRGRPVAAVIPLDQEAFEDWVLANAPEFVASLREAEDDMRAGRTISLDELLARDTRRRKRTAVKRPSARKK